MPSGSFSTSDDAALTPRTAPVADLAPAGSFGPYRPVETLVPGVKDKTFLAEDAGTGARVALRVLDESVRDGDVFEALREHAGRVTALATRCPAIAAIYECGRAEGAIYLALEHPSGPTLAETLQRDAPLTPERAVRLAIRIAEALESAHMLGIVHGSLTPRTVVLVGPDETVKLTQFGVDWLRATRRPGRASARSGVDASPYTAPEQALSGEATPQSDVYAVGAILYEALLGRPPAAPLSTRRPGSTQPLRKARPEVTRTLEGVVMRALESDPARRYRDMTDFFNDLWSEVNPFSSTTAPDGGASRLPSMAGWSRSLAVGIVLVVGGGIALLSWLLVGSSPEQLAAPRAVTPRPEATAVSAPPPPPASEPAPVQLPPVPPPVAAPPPALPPPASEPAPVPLPPVAAPPPALPPPAREPAPVPLPPVPPTVAAPPPALPRPAPNRPVVEKSVPPVPPQPTVELPARPAVETPPAVARPAPTPRTVPAPRAEPTPPARSGAGAAAAAPTRDSGEDAGAIIDWLLKESSSARR
jgi:serine/threonine protein kinase